MAELVDALDSGSSRGNSVDVRVILAAMQLLGSSVCQVALVANGAIDDLVRIADRLKRYPFLVAVDGGLNYCHLMNVKPHLIVGDMDSTSESLLKNYSDVPIRRFNCEKNETDLELALNLVDNPQVKEITVFGGLNKRLDHTLANLHLLRRYPGKVSYETETERVFAIQGSVEIPTVPGQTLSLLPLGGPIRGVSSKGLRWELRDASFDAYSLSISNLAETDRVSIHIAEGDLICVVGLQ